MRIAVYLLMLLTMCAASAGATAQQRVANELELAAVLAAAKGGERIELAAGDYGALNLSGRTSKAFQFRAPVTIVSADPARPARFSRMMLSYVDNVRFEHIRFKYDYNPGDPVNLRAFAVHNSQRISIVRSHFDGDEARETGTYADGFGTATALLVAHSRDILVERTLFERWHRAAVFNEVDQLVVRGNEARHLRSDGFNFARVADTLIEDNHIHSFRTAAASGDHPDMIQFWTNQTKAPTVNVIIRNNLLDIGSGPWTQTIFIRNEEVDRKRAGREMYYRNLSITGNLIRNSHVHGIAVGETDGLIIANNTLIQAADSPRPLHVTVPGIKVTNAAENVRIENNVAPRFSDPQAGWVFANNVTIQRNFPRAPNFYSQVFVDALPTGDISVSKLAFLPGGLVADKSGGSPRSQFETRPKQPVALLKNTPLRGGRNAEQEFSILAFGPSGAIDLTGAKVVWTFSGGVRKSGLTATHRFEQPGIHQAKALLTLPDGRELSAERTLVVE